MELDPLLIWGASAGALVVLLALAVLILALRLGSLGDAVRRFGASHDSIHVTVRERLDEVSRRLGDGLTKSDTTIGEIRERLAVIDEAQKHLTDLSTKVVGLQDVLSNKQARGAFGEIQLQDIVETALPPSAYSFQHTLGNGKRPDCVVMLPNPPGPIAIDAKFPLESYRKLRATSEETEHVQAGRAFSRDLKKHISDIADKYVIPGETAESALLFLPSEAVYAELHANFSKTVEESYRRRVWIVSPTTLMATLNTVRAILRDVRMREQAEVIRIEIIKLLDDVRRLDERVNKLSNHHSQAAKDIEDIRKSTNKITHTGDRIRSVDMAVSDETSAADGNTQPELEVGFKRH